MDTIFVSLDVEATGLEQNYDEIIEVAAVKFRGTELLDSYSSLVRPRQAVPLKILRMTGIDLDALNRAPTFRQIGGAFANFIGNAPIVGHSLHFDLGMLRKHGMQFRQPTYDTFDLATLLLPQVPAYRLSALAEHFRIAHPADHRALNDADVTRQVFVRLLEKIEALSLRDLLDLQRLMNQTDWGARELFDQVLKQKTNNAWDVEATRRIPPQPSRLRPAPTIDNPLRATGSTEPLDLAQVAGMFASDGILGRMFPGYEQRAPQVDMARAIAQAFNEGGMLLVEAGTGTGKSMAYLLPAALYALQRGERVVISTNTINLQDQLYNKDIPDVQRMLAEAPELQRNDEPLPDLQAQLLKGRSNYLCLRRYKQVQRETEFAPHEARAMLKVQFWLPTTTSGDRAELLLLEDEQVAWGRINVTPDTCTGARCPDFRECFFFRARRQAEAAHIIVVNHALLLADLVAQSHIIPPFEHLIIDEAHNLEDVATDQLGFHLDQAALLKLCDDLYSEEGRESVSGLLSSYQISFRESSAEPADREKADQLADALRPLVAATRTATYACFNHLLAFIRDQLESSRATDNRFRITPAVRRKPEWAELEQVWENLSLPLREIGERLGQFETLLLDLEGADLADYDELLLRVQWLKRTCTEIRVQLGHIVQGNDELVGWLTYDATRNQVGISAAPLQVAEILQAQLFAEKQTTILTSATLAVNESFAYVRDRLGVYEPTELQLESPFDYRQQALLYIPDDIPEPNQSGYQDMLEEALIALCAATQGRTLALFTANSTLRQTYAGIQDALEAHEITVLAQNIDGTRRALLERFKQSPRTVLLGTTSFWEGVDVVGDALSVLVITKLPFAVPSDPVVAARSEQFSDPFMEYSVPQSILRFKQGFGRLIRSRKDRGIVVVLDKRLLSKKYGAQFLQSLPHTDVRRGALKHLPKLAAQFLKPVLDAAAESVQEKP